ncbi:MAG: hypothetical protein IT442_11380 [Phycisphaeraceae bacterium]|nr:hypothetical protein [Phycisphaeraceae bacterium]
MPSNTNAIRAGRAYVELFADSSKLIRGLRLAQAKLEAFGQMVRGLGLKMTALGAAMVAPMLAATKVFAGMGDDLAKMSARTGVSVESLSELGFAAELSGMSMEDLETSLRKMQKTLVEAASGSAGAVDALAKLGLTAEDLQGLSPDEQLKRIADRLASIRDPALRAALAMEVFGKTGTKLLPLMQDGAAGIEALQRQARELGLTISTQDAKAAEQFADTLEILWKVLKQNVFVIGSALVPLLSKVAEVVTNAAVGAAAWIRQNKGLVVSAFAVAVGITTAGAAMLAAGYAITGLGKAIGALATILTGVGSALNLVVVGLVALTSPIGLVITAVTALGAAVLYSGGAGAKALEWLGEQFTTLKSDAVVTFQGIADALAAGDVALAAKILWLGLKMEWTRGINYLESAWLTFRGAFVSIGVDAWHGLLAVAEIAWHGLSVGWIETVDALAQSWTWFTTVVQEAWAWVGKELTRTWNALKGLFDSTFDTDTANAAADSYYQQKKNQLEDEAGQKIAQRELDRQKKREDAHRRHDETMIGIGQENIDAHKKLDEEYAHRLAENERDLDMARKAWQEAVEEAKKRLESSTPDSDASGGDLASRVRASVADLGDLLADFKAKTIDVAGTFNADAILGLQSDGGVAERTATATEQTARNTARLVSQASRGGLTFA